ncbi:unnamed protein product [Caenorhabditis bovis]|uniref:Homeobox domain-containing protein n=1 Tax=Caenorhabditis bovis TaxID=2654633 RepID=A0A8S1E8H3_9PELO|nr:unnamed protein product [Caenorhabditis bovis]
MSLPVDMTTAAIANPQLEMKEDKELIEAPKNNGFNISEILDNEQKTNHQSSPSASSEDSGNDADQPTVNIAFDPRVSFPFAALLHHNLLTAATPNPLLGAIPMIPFMGFQPQNTLMHFKNMMPQEFVTRTEESHEDNKANGKPEELRDSTGGSPLESDVDDDDETARGSDDDANSSDPSIQRKKKTRTVFSRSQVSQLEMTFEMKRYLSSQERSHLAQKLNLTETQVKIWFQNRRNKFKRQAQSDDPNISLQLHRANMFTMQSNASIQNAIAPPASSSPINVRPALPAHLDASAAARFLFNYSALAAQAQNLI